MLSWQFCDLSALDIDAYQSDSAQRKLFLAGAVSAVALPDQAVEAVYDLQLQQYHIHVHSLPSRVPNAMIMKLTKVLADRTSP